MKTTGQSLHYTGGCTPSGVNSNPWKREREGGKEKEREKGGERERGSHFKALNYKIQKKQAKLS